MFFILYNWIFTNKFILLRYDYGNGGWWYDIPWHDNRNVNQANLFIEKLLEILNTFPHNLDLYNFHSDFVTDLAYFQFNILNPFYLMDLIGLGAYSIFFSTFFSAILFYVCCRKDILFLLDFKRKNTSFEKKYYFDKEKNITICFALFFIFSWNLNADYENTPLLSDIFLYFIYLIFFLRVFYKQEINYKFYFAVFIISPLICSILFPLYIFFTYLGFIILFSFNDIQKSDIKKNIFFICSNFFFWIGWILSNLIANDGQNQLIFNFSSALNSKFIINDFNNFFYSILYGKLYVATQNLFVPIGALLLSVYCLLKNKNLKKYNKIILAIIIITFFINYFVNTELFSYLMSNSKYIKKFNSIPFIFINFFIFINIIYFFYNNQSKKIYSLLLISFLLDMFNQTFLKHAFYEGFKFLDLNSTLTFLTQRFSQIVLNENLNILLLNSKLILIYFLFLSVLLFKKNLKLIIIFIFIMMPHSLKIFHPHDITYAYKNATNHNLNKKKYLEFSGCLNNIIKDQTHARVIVTGVPENGRKRMLNILTTYTSELETKNNLDFVYKYREKKRPEIYLMYKNVSAAKSIEYINDIDFFKKYKIEYALLLNDKKNIFEKKFKKQFDKIGSCKTEFKIHNKINKFYDVNIYKINYENKPYQYIDANDNLRNLEITKFQNKWLIPRDINIKKNQNVFINYPYYNGNLEKTKIYINGKIIKKSKINFDHETGLKLYLIPNDVISIEYRNFGHFIMLFSFFISVTIFILMSFLSLKKLFNLWLQSLIKRKN